jgi:hypothetical protein
MEEQFFDPAERAREKQAARQQDSDDLISGRVSAQELQRRNGFIPGHVARSAEILEWREFD